MVATFKRAALLAAATALALGEADAFQPWRPDSRGRQSHLSAGKGFGGAKTNEQKPKVPPVVVAADNTDELSPLPAPSSADAGAGGGGGSKLLAELRSREAEKRDMELTKLRELRETDRMLQEDGGAAAIPERVAQRMGKRMLPFVGLPLFGSLASFVGFWYMATYKDMVFQPALVATTSFVFLAIGLIGITYSVLSSSWDDDREGSALGIEEFGKNVDSLKDGLSRTKENALLREKMAGLSEEEIQSAIDGQEKRRQKSNKKDAWME